MSTWNLPPGCTTRDIDDAMGGDHPDPGPYEVPGALATCALAAALAATYASEARWLRACDVADDASVAAACADACQDYAIDGGSVVCLLRELAALTGEGEDAVAADALRRLVAGWEPGV